MKAYEISNTEESESISDEIKNEVKYLKLKRIQKVFDSGK
jgi:hypothetical protein